jgi:multicomponent Na+:H+ antiporter subunit C
MTPGLLYLLTGIALFVIGAAYLVVNPHLLGKILAVNVAGSGVFLVFIATAYRTQGAYPDPVPHAMVLTGIVVAVSATALALALAVRIKHVQSHSPHERQ